jgi:hypothetical protein
VLSFAPVNQWSGSFTVSPGYFYSQPFGAHIQVSVANSDGNWLFALVTWQSGAPEPSTMAIGDDAGNDWRPLGAPVGTSSAAGSVRAAVWAAADAAPASTVWVSPSGWAPCYTAVILEVPGLGPGLSVQAADTAYVNGGTSLATAIPAPSAPSFALALMGSDQPGSFSSGPGAGWTALPPVRAAVATLFGAHISQSDVGAASWTAAYAAWLQLTGIPLTAVRWYKTASDFSYDTTLQQMTAAGMRICLTLQPAYSPVSPSDLASLTALLGTLRAAGASVRVTLWHEPSFSGLTAAQYTAVIQYYGPAVRQYYPLYCVFTGSTETDPNSGYYPGGQWVDGVAIDAYAGPGGSGVSNAEATVTAAAALADGDGKTFAVWEFGGGADLGINPPPSAQSNAGVTSYFQWLQALVQARVAAGKPTGDILFFSSHGGSTGSYSFLGTALTQNGGFEGGLGNWISGSAVIGPTSAQAHSGSSAVSITSGAGGGTANILSCGSGSITTQGMPVTAGQTVGATGWFKSAIFGRSCSLGIQFYTAGGTSISTLSGSAVTDSAFGWAMAQASVTAPATSAWCRLVPSVAGTGASEVHYFDDPQMGIIPASNDLTSPVQYGWDFRVALLAVMQSAFQANPPGMMLSAAWQAASGTVTAAWSAASPADMAAVTVAATAAQAAPAGPSQGWPSVKVEAAFGAGIATPWDQLQWTDLTARYQGISGTRGRQYELDSVQAASMPVTLSNNDGALTPGNTSSLYCLGLSDWTAHNNAAIALSREQAQSGPVSMLMAPDGVTATPYAVTGQYAVPAPAAGWSGQAAVICPAGWAAGVQVQVNWYDSTHAYISTTSGATAVLAAGQWAYPSVTAGSPPGGAAYTALVLHVNGTPPAGTLFWWDSAYLTSPAGAVVNANPVFSAGPDVFTPLRKTETWQGRSYVTWRGFMERWPQSLTSARYTQANGTATDIYAGLTALLPVVAQGEILNDEPWGYWPCTDTAGSAAAANLAPTGTGALNVVTSKFGPGPSGTQAFGGTAPFPSADAGCWTQSGLNSGSTDMQHGYCLQLQATTTPPVTQGLTIEAWHEWSGVQPNGRLIIWSLQGAGGTLAQLWGDYDGSFSGLGWYLSVFDKSTKARTDYRVFPFGIETIGWSHFAVTLTPAAWTVTINGGGYEPAIASGTCNLPGTWQWITFGGSADRILTGGSSNISLAGLAVYPRVLPQPRVLAHQAAASGGLGGDGEGSRMTRLLSYPSMLVPRRLGLGPDAVLPATDISGQSCAQAVTNIAQSGGGLLYADRCGYLAYQSRDLRWNKAAAWAAGENAGSFLNSNWDFESGVTPWADHNGAGGSAGIALSASSAFAWSGSQSMLMLPDGATASAGAISEKCAVPSGATVTGSARLYCPAGYATGAKAQVNWYDASGAFLSTATGATVPLPAGGWAQVTVSAAAPGGAAQAALVISYAGTPAGSAFAYCDLALLTLPGEVPYLGDVTFDFDPAQVYDDVTISQVTGITVAVSDPPGIRQYGDLTLQETVYLSDPDTTADLASRLLADYGQPSTRVAAFTVDAAANPYAWQFVLSADVGTVVQVSRRLGGTLAVISDLFVIQSVSPNNPPGQYQVRYTATPYFLGALATNDPVRGLPDGSNPVAW